MDTVEDHAHSFAPDAWPFADASNTAAFTTVPVLREQSPVLLVFHDHDRDWQFLHGGVTSSDEGKIICMGCAYELDNTIGLLADLPAGWKATRKSAVHPWRRESYPDYDDEG